MWKDKVVRKGVISGIIASLIVIFFLTPLIELIWDLIKDSSLLIQKNIVDSIYTNAALGKRNWIDVEFALFLFSGMIGTILMVTSRLNRKLSNLKKKIKGEDDETEQKETPEEVAEKINKKIGKADVLSKVIYIPIIILIILLSYNYLKIYTDLQLNTSFEQRLNAVSPYISEQEEEGLKSKWALMQNRNDYEEINLIFETYEADYDIKLPESLMK